MHLDGGPNPERIDGLSAEQVRILLEDVAGIAAIDVDLRGNGVPRLVVRLDGSRSGDEVGEAIRSRLASVSDQADPPLSRRVGLGRGLADIIAADEESSVPAQLQPIVAEPDPAPSLALVAVEETAGGIAVRAADSAGGVAFSPVEDPRSLNQAVVSAVGRLRHERPLPRLSGVEIREVDGAAVLTVVLALADGRRAAGAALVDGGMPFTLGVAVWEALTSAS